MHIPQCHTLEYFQGKVVGEMDTFLIIDGIKCDIWCMKHVIQIMAIGGTHSMIGGKEVNRIQQSSECETKMFAFSIQSHSNGI